MVERDDVTNSWGHKEDVISRLFIVALKNVYDIAIILVRIFFILFLLWDDNNSDNCQ